MKICILILLLACLSGCTAQKMDYAPSSVPAEQVTEHEIQPQTTAEMENLQPMPMLHSGLREDGAFDEGTLFIGDSLTYGMVEGYLPDNGLLGGARYMAIPGAAITCYMQGPALESQTCACSPEFEGLYLYQGVEQAGEEVTAIYFMMGTNASKYATDQTYIDIVSHMLESCPNATVYLQLVPHNRSERVNSETANARVQNAFSYFADEPRVRLIDTQTAIGYNLAPDGIHLVTKGQECWYQAIVTYAAEHEIEQ